MFKVLLLILLCLVLVACVLGPNFFIKLYNEWTKPKFKVGDRVYLDEKKESFQLQNKTEAIVTHIGKKKYGYRFIHYGRESSSINAMDFKTFENIYKSKQD